MKKELASYPIIANGKMPIIIHGPFASGKTFLAYLLQHIVSPRKTLFADYNNVFMSFSELVNDHPKIKLFVIDELPSDFDFEAFFRDIGYGVTNKNKKYGIHWPLFILLTRHNPPQHLTHLFKVIEACYGQTPTSQ